MLADTRTQVVLTLPDPDAMVVREFLAGLLEAPETNRSVAAMIAGTDIRYPMPGAPDHPLLGARAPGVRLPTGRGALLASAVSAVATAADGWADRIDRPGPGPAAAGGEALLLRPDGHVCWAGRDDDADGLRGALARWFGASRTLVVPGGGADRAADDVD